MTFVVTTSARGSGARLSLLGRWGNLPFPNADAAEAEARRIGGVGVAIVRERVR